MSSLRAIFGDTRTSRGSALPVFGQPWLWVGGFTIIAYILSREALTPVVPDTSFSLISLPLALLAFALMVRPWAEAPIYILIHATAGLLWHEQIEFQAFASVRLGIEIVQTVVLVRILRGYFLPRLVDQLFVALYTVAVLVLTALGGLLLLGFAWLFPSLGIEVPYDLADEPTLAWRHWWLGHACSYLALAGPAGVLVALRKSVARTMFDHGPERRAFLWMALALLAASLLAYPIADLSGIGLPADVLLSVPLIPLPFAVALASRFRAKGASCGLLILTPIVILSVSGPNAAANWGVLPPISTPTQALLLMTATACMFIAAISRQVLKATVNAMEASQAKARFVSMLHHELRTPLNAILGFSELMRMQKIRDIDEAMAPFENIHASGQRLLAMIEGLLNQADHGASAFELHKHLLNLNELIGGVVEELQPEMSAFRFPVTINIPDNLSVEADSRAMKQILMVLLAYPLRFVTPWTEVSAVAQQVGTDTVLDINSRGLVGAANDDRDRLELQLVTALALAHGARLSIVHADRDRRQARLTFFATHAAA
ncbi:MAG: HAMP domain-containing histidine kinase [Pseudomonadota bacterium]|nr:HAMP domain-containing histidine kinase [Pseudomonadota bacterium]